MPIEITRTAYYYSDLEGKAKEKANAWMQGRLTEWFHPSDLDYIIDEFKDICDILGIEITTNGRAPAVYWDISYSQSDGASFDGAWRGVPTGNTELIKANYPNETKLHEIAEFLETESSKYFYHTQKEIYANITCSSRNHHTNVIFYEEPKAFGDLGEKSIQTITASIRALNQWLYEKLCAAYEQQTGREAAEDCLLSDEEDAHNSNQTPTYLFNADGFPFK